MSPQERLEFWKAMVPLIGITLTSLLVQVIHAFVSSNRGKENRQQNQQILEDVSQVKGKLEGSPGAGEDGGHDNRLR